MKWHDTSSSSSSSSIRDEVEWQQQQQYQRLSDGLGCLICWIMEVLCSFSGCGNNFRAQGKMFH